MIKKNSWTVYLLLLQFILFSCDREKFRSDVLLLDLEIVGSLEIELDSLTKKNHYTSYFADEIKSFFIYNDLVHSIYGFDINSGNQKTKIQLFKDGPNKVDDVVSIYTKDGLTFTLLTKYGELIELGQSGNIIQTNKLLSRNSGGASLINRPKIFADGESFFVTVRPNNITEKKNYASLMKGSFDIDEIEYIFPYPNNINISNWGAMVNETKVAFVDSKNMFVVSFPFSEDLYAYYLDGKLAEKHLTFSELMPPPRRMEKSSDIDYSTKYLLTNSWFLNLLYDDVNKVFYRLGSIGYSDKKGDPLKGEFFSKNKEGFYHTLLILDENFKKVGEVKGVNIPNYSFISDGLLYTPNFQKKLANEDVVVFDIYKLRSINNAI